MTAAGVNDFTRFHIAEFDHLVIPRRNNARPISDHSESQHVAFMHAEREEIRSALLRYCELDTLAMVMLYEAWADLVNFPVAPQ